MTRELTISIADDVYYHLVSGRCKPENVCGFAEHIVGAVYDAANGSGAALELDCNGCGKTVVPGRDYVVHRGHFRDPAACRTKLHWCFECDPDYVHPEPAFSSAKGGSMSEQPSRPAEGRKPQDAAQHTGHFAITDLRRAVTEARNRPGMIAGMPKVTVDASRLELVLKLADERPELAARLAALEAAAKELAEAAEAGRNAIDILFSWLIERDRKFYPSQSGDPWEALLQINAAIAAYDAAAAQERAE